MTDSDAPKDAGPPPAQPVRLRSGALSPRRPTRFVYQPEAAKCKVLAQELGLLGLYRLRFAGEVLPDGTGVFKLSGQLTAEVSQACVVTLQPVVSQCNETVRRRYVADLPPPEGDEVEMPADDSQEPMPEVIDLAEIAAETLMLALPLYPRAPGAELGSVVHAGADVTPLTDSDLKPFAGLSALAGRLRGGPTEGSGDPG